VYAFDIEGVTTCTIEGEQYLVDPGEAKRSRTVVLRVFTHRPYMVSAEVGAVGGLDQLEGVRLATENLLAPPRPALERHRRSIGDCVFVLQDVPGGGTFDAIDLWLLAFADRGDVSLVVTVDSAERGRELAHHPGPTARGRIEVRQVEKALYFDGPVILFDPSASTEELLAAAPPPRWGAPPWSCIASADKPPAWFR